jgi:DNA helicase-2/ATP-dependent DNA helicase PcrA
MAILYRTNAQSRLFEEQLIRRHIPYRIVAGTRFYDRKEIRDALAYLRVVNNPNDSVSVKRIINAPARGIGKTTLDRLTAYCEKQKVGMWEALTKSHLIQGVNAKADYAIRKLVEVVYAQREKRHEGSMKDILFSLLTETRYIQVLKDEGTPEALARIDNLGELLNVAREWDESGMSGGLTGFLEQISLVSDVDSIAQSANSVTLMTIHASKGLEYPVVFMVGMEESIFPHLRSMDSQSDMEEERRLCYVGMTRAREQLHMSASIRRLGSSQKSTRNI